MPMLRFTGLMIRSLISTSVLRVIQSVILMVLRSPNTAYLISFKTTFRGSSSVYSHLSSWAKVITIEKPKKLLSVATGFCY